jgi:S-adenosylmethionine-diacylgycerolhomoserine-N-methlytransferase
MQIQNEPASNMSGGRSHAALINRIYRHQRHVYDLTRSCVLLGRDRLIRELNPPPGGCALEIGCGTGRNLLAAAARFPNVMFYGLDISTEMLKTAHRSIAASSVANRIKLATGDAVSFEPRRAFGQEKFDRIFFFYSLSMVPSWQTALAHASTILAPGGQLLAVDFGHCDGLPAWFRGAFFKWLSLFHVTPLVDPAAFGRALSNALRARMEWHSLLRGYAWTLTLALPNTDRSQRPSLRERVSTHPIPTERDLNERR